MPNPFPGMNPFIEATGAWSTFHHAFLNACHDLLNERLPGNYVARIEERVTVVAEEEQSSIVFPDVVVSREEGPAPRATSPIATIEPYVLPQKVVWLDKPKEGFIQIVRLPHEQVITCVEVLSPSNKSGVGRSEYLTKRRDLLWQDINLVEIDLLVKGRRLAMLKPLPQGNYFAFITHMERRNECTVYAWSVRRELPTIPIPLAAGDGEVPLDLASAFSQTYARGRYDRVLRYKEAPPAEFAETDRVWIAERAAGAIAR
jgi:hypothetical protein